MVKQLNITLDDEDHRTNTRAIHRMSDKAIKVNFWGGPADRSGRCTGFKSRCIGFEMAFSRAEDSRAGRTAECHGSQPYRMN